MKNIVFLTVALLIHLTITQGCSSTSKASISKEQVTAALAAQKWNFTVTLVSPQSGGGRQPNDNYSLSLAPDNLNVYLPYIGRAYGGANVLSGENVLHFVSQKFSIQQSQIGQDKWEITLQVEDREEKPVFNIIVWSNGNASLAVRMNNRSPISYSGYITAVSK